MMPDPWMDVGEAARLLDVAPARVRQLIDAGELRADRWAGRWRIDRAAFLRFAHRDRHGRPYSPAVAWEVLGLLDNGLRRPDVGRQQRARARAYAKQVARGHAEGLRRRARLVRARVHPGLVQSLASEVVLGGASALAADDPNRLSDDGVLEAYVRAARWPGVVRTHKIQDDADANVVIRVVDDALWPFPEGARDAGQIVAAVDLLEQGDERADRAARSILARAGRTLR